MPIEIIPKEKRKVSRWQTTLFFISLLFLLLIISGYFILKNFQKKSQVEIKKLDESLAQLKTPEKVKMENDVKNWKQKIDNFSTVLNEHFFISGVFSLLEKTTHPKVMYTEFELNPEKNELTLSGKTDDFSTLGQQVLSIKKESMIENLTLEEVSISKEGKVEFIFNISFNPEIFQWQE